MNTNRKNALIAGALFLLAIVASILGGTMIEANLVAPDGLIHVSADRSQVALGVILELVNAIAVIGIAALLYPILRKHNPALSAGYLGNRVVEAILQIVGSSIPLALVAVSQAQLETGALETTIQPGSGVGAITSLTVTAQ